MAEKVPVFARRKLISTTSSQKVGKIRAALTQAGIPFHIGLRSVRMPPHYPLPAYEYTFYVHKDDIELAEAALAGSLD